MTFFHRAVEDGFERLLLGLEHDGPAGEAQSFFAGDFCDCPFRGEVAVKNDDVTVFFDRLVERLNDGLTGRIRLHAGERLGHGLAGDGEGVAVEQAGVEQRLHEWTDAADGDEFGHDMFAAGLEVGEHGHAFADTREIVEHEFHLRGVRDGEEVKHGVGRAAQRDHDGDGVLERIPRQDVERANSFLEHLDHRSAGAPAVFHLRLGHCVLR